jgi:hypothetical protein
LRKRFAKKKNKCYTFFVENYLLPFLSMENLPMQVSYSIKEKYFQVEPENRIRRYQYFVRSIIPGILLAFIMMFVIPTIMTLIYMMGFGMLTGIVVGGWISMALVNLSYIFLAYKTGIPNIIKRCHDFGSD